MINSTTGASWNWGKQQTERKKKKKKKKTEEVLLIYEKFSLRTEYRLVDINCTFCQQMKSKLVMRYVFIPTQQKLPQDLTYLMNCSLHKCVFFKVWIHPNSTLQDMKAIHTLHKINTTQEILLILEMIWN